MDAIDEYSRRLVHALGEIDAPAVYLNEGLSSARRSAERPPWILLQYMPFSYGRWGIAPWLISDAATLRRAGSRFVVMVHEAWVEMHDWRTTFMGGWQRIQLHALIQIADAVIVTTEALGRALGKEDAHVPVASNITPITTTRHDARALLGFSDELVVALFGNEHPTRALDHANAAITALACRTRTKALRVLNLGKGGAPLDAPAGIDVETPGYLPADEISLRLLASDLILLPFTDGVSTRRTTLMAALAHGVPVLGSRGAHTDSVLLSHPEALFLTPTGDPRAFANAAVGLTENEPLLRATGEAGRRLYHSRFDWPIVATRVAAVVRP